MSQDIPEDITGSHEEFWTFSQVSQWGSHWRFSSDEHLNKVRDIVVNTRKIGIAINKLPPRFVHHAQMLLWRFYLNESPKNFPPVDIVPLAFESATQMLEAQSQLKQINEFSIKIFDSSRLNQQRNKGNDFKKHFNMVSSLDFNIHIHHPSDYLSQFITPEFDENQINLAECIISDSYLCPCCLVHMPKVIAEGAAIMAAAMTNSPNSVIPRNPKATSFIQDMKCFHKQSANHKN